MSAFPTSFLCRTPFFDFVTKMPPQIAEKVCRFEGVLNICFKTVYFSRTHLRIYQRGQISWKGT